MSASRREQRAPIRNTDGDWVVLQSQGSQPKNASSQGHRKLVRAADGTWEVPRSQEHQSTQAPSDAFKDSSPPHEIGGYTSDSNLPSIMNTDSSPAHLPDYGNYRSTTISATDNGSPSMSAVVDDQHETIQPGDFVSTHDIRSTPPVLDGFDSGQIDDLPGVKEMDLNAGSDDERLSQPSTVNNNLQSDVESESYIEKEDEDPSYQPSEIESRPGASQTTVSSGKKKRNNPRALQAEVRQLEKLSQATTDRSPARKSPFYIKPNPDPGRKFPSSRHAEDISASLPPVHNMAKRLYEKRAAGAHSQEVVPETQTEQPCPKATTRRVAKRPYFESDTLAEDPQNKSVLFQEKDVEMSFVPEDQHKGTDSVKYQRRPSQAEPPDPKADDLWDIEGSPEPATASNYGQRVRGSTKSRIKKPNTRFRQGAAAKRKKGSRAVPQSKSQPQFDTDKVDPIEDSGMEDVQAHPGATGKRQTLVQKMRTDDGPTTASSSNKLISKTTTPTANYQTDSKVKEQTASKLNKMSSPGFVESNLKESSLSKEQPSEEKTTKPEVIHFDPRIGIPAPQPQESENQPGLTKKEPEDVGISHKEDVTATIDESQLSVPHNKIVDENIKPNTHSSHENQMPLNVSIQDEDPEKEALAPRHLPFRKRGEPRPDNKNDLGDDCELDLSKDFEKKRRICDDDSTETSQSAGYKRPRIETNEHNASANKKSEKFENTTPGALKITGHVLNVELKAPLSDRKASASGTGSQIFPSIGKERQAIDKSPTSTINLETKEDVIPEQNHNLPPIIRINEHNQKPNWHTEENSFASNHTVPIAEQTAHRDNQPSLVFTRPSPSGLGAKSQPEYCTDQDFPSNQALYLQSKGSRNPKHSNVELVNGDYFRSPRLNNHNGNYNSRKLHSSSDDVFLHSGDTKEPDSSSFVDKLRQAQTCDRLQVPILHHRPHLSDRQLYSAQENPTIHSVGIKNNELTKAGYPEVPREFQINQNASHIPNKGGRECGNPSNLYGKVRPDSPHQLHPRSRKFGQELADMNYFINTDHWKDSNLTTMANVKPTGFPVTCHEARPYNGQRHDQDAGRDLKIQQNVRRRWEEAVHAASSSLADSMHNINILLLNHLLSKEESINKIANEYKRNGKKIANNLLQRQKKELDEVNVAFRKECRELYIAYGNASKTTRDLRSSILAKSKSAHQLASEKRQRLQTARLAINAAREELKAS